MLDSLFGSGSHHRTHTNSQHDDVVSLFTHELRTPLSVIKWYTEMLLDGDAGHLTDDQKKYLTTITASNEQAIDLIRSLLNVSRVTLDTFCISPTPVSLRTLIPEVVLLLDKKLHAHHMDVQVEVAEDVGERMLDSSIMRFVVKQILLNAIAFSPDTSVITVRVSLCHKGEVFFGQKCTKPSIVIAVTDQGTGIKEEDKPKIGTQAFRKESVHDDMRQGLGLSLYSIQNILKRGGGSLWFTSTVEKGSTFCVAFPSSGMKKKIGTTTFDA